MKVPDSGRLEHVSYNYYCMAWLYVYYAVCGVVSLHKVVEVREGQKTKQFDKFPFEEVSDQSFSLIFEEERRSNESSSVGLLRTCREDLLLTAFFFLDRQEVCTPDLPGFYL